MDEQDREMYSRVVDALLANTQAYNRMSSMLELVHGSVTQLTAMGIRLEAKFDAIQPAE